MTTLTETILRWLRLYGYDAALARLQRAEARLGVDHLECQDARAALDQARPEQAPC